MMKGIRILFAAAAGVVGCSSSSGASSSADAGAEIDSLIASTCERDYICEGSPPSTSAAKCAVLVEDQLVGSPAECPLDQEIECLKEAAALPCADAGGSAEALAAVAVCTPCFPPGDVPDASPNSPVEGGVL